MEAELPEEAQAGDRGDTETPHQDEAICLFLLLLLCVAALPPDQILRHSWASTLEHSLLCTSWPHPKPLQTLLVQGLYSDPACLQPVSHLKHSALLLQLTSVLRAACPHGGALNFGCSFSS